MLVKLWYLSDRLINATSGAAVPKPGNPHPPDIMRFLDTKRENADEKIRIKTLSLGVVIPDVTFELAKRNADMYLFSPHDVEKVYGKAFSEISVTEKYDEMVGDKRIRKKKINAREFFQTLAEIQFESGYPYIMFEENGNAGHTTRGGAHHIFVSSHFGCLFKQF